MKVVVLLVSLIALSGCMAGGFEDDLRGVPVTNNPTLLPSTAQTAHMPTF